jgi:monoamine oxidase
MLQSIALVGREINQLFSDALLEEALLPGDARRLRIAGGMDLLPGAMAGALGGRIHYGRPVTRVEQSTSGVRVHAEGYGGPLAFDAERVIVAAPFPPLRRVTFDPPLSAGKQRAIRELAYDSLSRVALQVRRRPWEARGWSGFARTDLPSEVWHTTWDTPGERGVLSVYVKERASLRLTAMDADDRLAYAAEHVEAVLPGTRAEVEGGTAKCWSEDPWAGGAHSFPPPGQMFDLLPHAATVEGRVHFAGEHTSLWQAWMQGALESGERAAREVNDAP